VKNLIECAAISSPDLVARCRRIGETPAVVRELHHPIWEYPTRQTHMICSLKFWKNIALSGIVMGGISFMTGSAQASTPPHYIFSAQKRLSATGYYRGPLDGRYNRRTVRALRNFQSDHNLAETGRLNRKTCKMLGASCKTMR
jgi:hypothetical protein